MPEALHKRLRLRIRGVVQGVGFRPYVYNLAQRHRLTGFVLNSPTGVVVEVEGPSAVVDAFVAALPAEAPPLVEIDSLATEEVASEASQEFAIRKSDEGEAAFAMVPADICVCEDCLRELRDSANRRYQYPFTNCTNCGPRYSIIRDVPYDRRFTTMAEFVLCPECRREYEDPANRRFHAQPNACPVCGPRMQLVVPGTQPKEQSAIAILEEVARMLGAGGIVAWKGLGGYQLACDATSEEAVRELRKRKRRSEKPFAVMVADAAAARHYCTLSAAEERVLVSRERPIVLLARREESSLSEAVSPGNPATGVMLPSTPMHAMLFDVLRRQSEWPVLVMTSGNLSEEPIVLAEDEAENKLGDIADAFVHHNRPIHTRVDDSVVRVFASSPMLIRRARGYVPNPVPLSLGETEVLACGAQQKSTLCLTRDGNALVSQHLGDLENLETLAFFEQTRERMQKLFHVAPTAIAHDLHPNYMSTQYALKQSCEQRIAVQHHHAHIASCMAEHGLRDKVIGVAWDGTGYGTDGTIWGGEFLVADLAGFTRFAHLRTVALAGGDRAVREPWRIARSYLRDAYGDAIPAEIASLHPVAEQTAALIDTMIARRVHAMATSSAGRLFDAAASILGLYHTVSFEGQAAMALEAVAHSGTATSYEFALNERGGLPLEVDLRPMIRQMVEEQQQKTPAEVSAARLHATLSAVILAVCQRMREQLGLGRVCLSGGCFQNLLLLGGTVERLRAAGFEAYFQQQIPANDGGISLGQAAVAMERIRLGL